MSKCNGQRSEQIFELCAYINLFELLNEVTVENYVKNHKNLEKLIFGYSFNKPISNNMLPVSLTKLKFGYYFNQAIKIDTLPIKLKKLEFGNNFNQPINKNYYHKV